MNLRTWLWTAGSSVLFASRTSLCAPGNSDQGLFRAGPALTTGSIGNGSGVAPSRTLTETRPYPTGAPFTNTSVAKRPPNPCLSDPLQPPVYQFSHLTVYKSFFNDYNTDPRFFWSTVNFTLRDVANNYSFRCNWGPRNPGAGQSWETQDCVPETGPIPDPSQSLTLLNLWPEYLLLNKSSQDPVRVVQYWYCDIEDQSYPQVYQSRAEVFFNVTCPDQGIREIDYPCDVATQFPVVVNAQWQPTGSLPGTPRLRPRPNPQIPIQEGLNPPPKEDCTEMSLTHPEWELSELYYSPETVPWEYTTARLNFSLWSRATGAQVTCRFEGESTNIEGSLLIALCSPQSRHFESRSVFVTRFRGSDKWLYVQEDWVCGDVQGLHL